MTILELHRIPGPPDYNARPGFSSFAHILGNYSVTRHPLTHDADYNYC